MNINPTKSGLSYNQIFKKLNPDYEHREKGLIKPQVKKYTKSDYKKNEVGLYEYPSKNMVSPNSVISSNEKYLGYTYPPVGLMAPDKNKVGFYEYPKAGLM